MINLLPDELKQSYRYGRHNNRLRRWIVALLFGLVGVGAVTTSGMLYLQHSIDHNSQQAGLTRQSLQASQLDQTRSQAQEITSSLKLATEVLSREVLFSKLLKQVASVTPANTSLTDLSISTTAQGSLGSLDLTAASTDYSSATQLQVNLADPANQIFSKAEIQSITCNAASTNPRYPCTVTIKALFSNNNPYLFINKTNGTAKR